MNRLPHTLSKLIIPGAPEQGGESTRAAGFTHTRSPLVNASPGNNAPNDRRSAPVAGLSVLDQSSASPARRPAANTNPYTPERLGVTVPVLQFTPGTGVEMQWSYMLQDVRDRTRKDVYEGNRQRAEGQIVVDVPIEEWLAQCAPAPAGMGSGSSPQDWEKISLELFTKSKVPSTHGETKFVRGASNRVSHFDTDFRLSIRPS